jgi:hypothetical protein
MPQFGRPSTDTYNGDGWTEDDGTSTNMFQEIDETSFDDADYVKSADAPSADAYVTKLTSVTDPVSSSGHVLRWRRRAPVSGGATVTLQVQLRQGYVNEGTPGTLIAEEAATNVTDTAFTADSITLSGAEADAITNYADLFVRFVANQP